MITRKQKNRLISALQYVCVKVLGCKLLLTHNGKYVFTNLTNVPYQKENPPKSIALIGAQVIEEAKDVFKDIPTNDKNYQQYMPLIEKIEEALNGDYTILEDIA